FMAACGAMKLKTGVARSGLLLSLAVLLVAGCSQVVAGRALISVPRPGTPIEWGPCEAGPSDQVRIPPGAECGMLSVPVDWVRADAPDGEVAQIAVLRIKAAGEKIGS